ncbi:transposase, partial [Cognatishimia sp. F0-27]|uniref:IS110 family transposase n=1 Tax=Cognatishimia sp. F0-27 TaxID=2816855 RepID=UPI001D0C3506|nr:transposase [Cognatishimia sp. F0-27]
MPPAQVKAFAQGRSTQAKTDRIDAELIARFFAFRAEAGRGRHAEKLRRIRGLTSKRAQLVEICKRLLAQIRAHQKLGAAKMSEDADNELKKRIECLIKEIENGITQAFGSDDHLTRMAIVLRSILGVGPVASTILIGEMPEIGTITGEAAAAITGLAPIAQDSGTLPG